MLCHCLSLVSSSLGKQQLKSGLSLEEVAAATRSAYLAAPNERLGKKKRKSMRKEPRAGFIFLSFFCLLQCICFIFYFLFLYFLCSESVGLETQYIELCTLYREGYL